MQFDVQHPALNLDNWNATLTLADKALYLVKTHGKAGWLQMTPKDSAPNELAAIMSTYTELELVKTDWFKLEGSPEILRAIDIHCPNSAE